jgi:tRNA threonylcarbamoyladenosine biosynthesis protein TsaB
MSMKNLLAIETSTSKASVALCVNDVVLHETLESEKTQAQSLLPIIAELFEKAQIKTRDLDGIVFGQGPGSFTGLRIACSFAKGLAYGHNIPLIPVGGLAAIAYRTRQLYPQYNEIPILATLDARMQELYWGYFEATQLVSEDRLSAANALYLPNQVPYILAGVDFEPYLAELPDKGLLQESFTVYPEATALLSLAQQGIFPMVASQDAKPKYVRNNVTHGAKSG